LREKSRRKKEIKEKIYAKTTNVELDLLSETTSMIKLQTIQIVLRKLF